MSGKHTVSTTCLGPSSIENDPKQEESGFIESHLILNFARTILGSYNEPFELSLAVSQALSCVGLSIFFFQLDTVAVFRCLPPICFTSS